MISLNDYKNMLSSKGNNLAHIRRNQSDVLTNNSFTQDPEYKRVYILTKDGWKFEDAKYQFHTTPSILRDAVDYYLQFRPKVHYPVGSYVIVPDDTDPNVNLTEMELINPFLQPINERTQWWMIVGRDNANADVRYNILQCNWNFRWLWDGEIKECFGAIRSASSYTSGKWTDEISSSLDNLTGAWLPDTYHVYKDKLKELHLDDTRTLMYEQRFLLTNNLLDPKVYQVTKVTDLSPQGIVKLSLKQDEFNRARDNLDLMICDYYTNSGDIKVDTYNPISDIDRTSKIRSMILNDAGELDYSAELQLSLEIGKSYYYMVNFSDYGIQPEWNIELLGEYSDEERQYYQGLIGLVKYDDQILMLKPKRAYSLDGKKFRLSVSDITGEYYSSIELEVSK